MAWEPLPREGLAGAFDSPRAIRYPQSRRPKECDVPLSAAAMDGTLWDRRSALTWRVILDSAQRHEELELLYPPTGATVSSEHAASLVGRLEKHAPTQPPRGGAVLRFHVPIHPSKHGAVASANEPASPAWDAGVRCSE